MRVIDIALKDLKQTLRSGFAIGMMVGAPLLLILLIYFAFGGLTGGEPAPQAIRVGVVNLDTLPEDAPLEESLGETLRALFTDPSVTGWLEASDFADEESARAAVNGQAIGVAVIVPAAFTVDVLAGREAAVTVVSDPTLTVGPQIAEAMVNALLQGVEGGRIALETVNERWVAEGRDPGTLDASALLTQYSTWYAETQRAMLHQTSEAALVQAAPATTGSNQDTLQVIMSQIAAGQMVFFAVFTGAFSMISLLREDEEGTLARLFSSPTHRTTILAGKFVAVFASVIVQGLVLLIATRYAFGVEWGDPVSVVLALVGQVAGATGLGVLLIAFVKTAKQAGPVIGGGLTAMGMLGGLFTGTGSLPEIFTRLADFTPQGWVIKAWKLTLAGQGPAELVTPTLVLLLIGAACFIIGAWRIQRRFA